MARYCFYSFLGVSLFLAGLFAQVPYYGPTSPSPSSIKVQVMVYDEPEPGILKIESVTFNGRNVRLQSPDLNGFRGGGGFQLQPGKYSLEWKVSRGSMAWPRTLSFKKTIEIQSRDRWVEVTVRGSEASVL